VICGIDSSFLVAAELVEHPDHVPTRAMVAECVARGAQFAIAPQVLAEFMHVATDARRFANPLTMEQAWNLAEKWWTAREVVTIFPVNTAVMQFLSWMHTHQLGRKRILDTLLAATYLQTGTTSLLTLNARDFAVFGCFQCTSTVGDLKS
jgi:predicted nucleic acid-binding protein